MPAITAEEEDNTNNTYKELRELTGMDHNIGQRGDSEKTGVTQDRSGESTLAEREKAQLRRKYEYKSKFMTRPGLKENAGSTQKVLQSRKASQPLIENFSLLNGDLVRRR